MFDGLAQLATIGAVLILVLIISIIIGFGYWIYDSPIENFENCIENVQKIKISDKRELYDYCFDEFMEKKF